MSDPDALSATQASEAVTDENLDMTLDPLPELDAANYPSMPDDGLRLPDMMTLPGENEFKPVSKPVMPAGGGAVIAVPPASSDSGG
ncbi:MAG: hypothetical protein ACO3RV_05150 [Luteolibacter sp.]